MSMVKLILNFDFDNSKKGGVKTADSSAYGGNPVAGVFNSGGTTAASQAASAQMQHYWQYYQV